MAILPRRGKHADTAPSGAAGARPGTAGRPGGRKASGRHTAPSRQAGGRYTPPLPRSYRESPRWVPITMFSVIGLGMLMIIVNYLGLLPPGEAHNGWLFGGLGLITAGFVVATQWR